MSIKLNPIMLNKHFIVLLLAYSISTKNCSSDQYCSSCYTDWCNECFRSYSEHGNCKMPENELKHCWEYNSKGICYRCDYGYYLANEKCERIVLDDCVIVDFWDSDKCITCSNGTKPTADGRCNGNETCYSGKCEICSQTGMCELCQPGYAFNDSERCVETKLENCLMQEERGGCTHCYPGFYNNNGECLRGKGELQKYFIKRSGGTVSDSEEETQQEDTENDSDEQDSQGSIPVNIQSDRPDQPQIKLLPILWIPLETQH